MLAYLVVGLVIGIIAAALFVHYKKVPLSMGKRVAVYVLWILALALIAFSCAWGIASFSEGETRSIAMGFLVFGGVGVILAVIAFRLGLPANKAGSKS